MQNETNPVVIIKTSLGDMTAELFPDKAPATVKNFLDYTDKGFYDGTIFHRVISGFMIQGGGFTEEMRQKPTAAPIVKLPSVVMSAKSSTRNDIYIPNAITAQIIPISNAPKDTTGNCLKKFKKPSIVSPASYLFFLFSKKRSAPMASSPGNGDKPGHEP